MCAQDTGGGASQKALKLQKMCSRVARVARDVTPSTGTHALQVVPLSVEWKKQIGGFGQISKFHVKRVGYPRAFIHVLDV